MPPMFESLWGRLNIQKGELCVKGISAQDLGFVWGPSQRGFGGFSGYGSGCSFSRSFLVIFSISLSQYIE